MRPTIDEHAAAILVDMALSRQGDVLGLRDFLPVDEQDDDISDQDNLDGMMELARDALGGDQPGVRRRAMQWPAKKRMDAVTMDLLTQMGVDAAVALVLDDALGTRGSALCIHDEDQLDDDDNMPAMAEVQADSWAIDLTPTVTWHSQGFLGVLYVPRMPDTVAVAAEGRPLTSVLTHPVLDRHALHIRSVVQRSNGESSITMTLPDPLTLGHMELRRRMLARAEAVR